MTGKPRSHFSNTARKVALYSMVVRGEPGAKRLPSAEEISLAKYRKIPMISPRLIFVQMAFLLGLFSGKLICGGAYYWRKFCVSKDLGLTIKTA